MYRTIKRELRPVRRTGTVVLANEDMAMRWDPVYKEPYGEILKMKGFIANQKRRVPLVDTDRSTVRNIVGSVTNLRIDAGRLLGEIGWARGEHSRMVEQKYLDGHLDTIVAEIRPEVIESIHGYKGYDGKVHIVKSWGVVVAIIRAAHGE